MRSTQHQGAHSSSTPAVLDALRFLVVELTNDPTIVGRWVGRTHSMTDDLVAGPARLLDQTLDGDRDIGVGDRLPALWHLVYFVESVATSRLGADGHPERGGFLPPVALPRRMWAGGRFTFHSDLRVGETVTKTSKVSRIEQKEGRRGPLCFVTVEHEFTVGGERRVSEEQDLVYRDDPSPVAPPPQPVPAPSSSGWVESIVPSEAMLFRYSALAFNAHRIHYDRDYARDVEGYTGLVVHGPLVATLLAGLAETSTSRDLETFSFRAIAPLIDTAPFEIAGVRTERGADLWARTPDNAMAMEATATFR